MSEQQEQYVGPCSLEAALAAAEPGPGGMRVAVSSPDGTHVAFQRKNRTHVRRVARLSGHCGSIAGTGEWREDLDAVEKLSWRPA